MREHFDLRIIKGRLNPQDLANVMKHLKENGFIDNHTRKVYGIDKYVIEQ